MNNASTGWAELETVKSTMEQKEDPRMCFSWKSNT
jgi:hypothetical protein